jgi:hypothetical protein
LIHSVILINKTILSLCPIGTENCLTLGINVTKMGGKLMLVGMGPQMVSVPLVNACAKEIDILSCFRYVNE